MRRLPRTRTSATTRSRRRPAAALGRHSEATSTPSTALGLASRDDAGAARSGAGLRAACGVGAPTALGAAQPSPAPRCPTACGPSSVAVTRVEHASASSFTRSSSSSSLGGDASLRRPLARRHADVEAVAAGQLGEAPHHHPVRRELAREPAQRVLGLLARPGDQGLAHRDGVDHVHAPARLEARRQQLGERALEVVERLLAVDLEGQHRDHHAHGLGGDTAARGERAPGERSRRAPGERGRERREAVSQRRSEARSSHATHRRSLGAPRLPGATGPMAPRRAEA